MSLIRQTETLINLCCAATILNLDSETVRQKKCGTEMLRHIRTGKGKRQRVSLVLEEVVMLKAAWIEAATPKSNSLNKSSGLKLVG